MSFWNEIESASDPHQSFESSNRPPHHESLGEGPKADWCRLSQEEQERRRDTAAFRKKLNWECKQRLQRGAARETIRDYHEYGLAHFDNYLEVIQMAQKYRGEHGARGRSIVTEYMRRQSGSERSLMLREVVMEHLIEDKRALVCLEEARQRAPRKRGQGGLQPLKLALGEALLAMMPDAECHCYRCDPEDPKFDNEPEEKTRIFQIDRDFSEPMSPPPGVRY